MINLKPFRQKPGFCGPASLKMVFGYYGIEKSEDELCRLAGCNREDGTHAHKMLAVGKKFGFHGLVKDNCSLADLRKWVSKGVPVIVNWFSTDEGHYSPVVAITEEYVTLMDPERGRTHRLKVGKFMDVWFDFNLPERRGLIRRRMIVIHP